MSELRRVWFVAALLFGVAMVGKPSAGVFTFGLALGCSNPAPPPNLPFPEFEPPSAIGHAGDTDETDAGADAVLPNSDEAVAQSEAKVVDSTQVGSAVAAGADAGQVDAVDAADERVPEAVPGKMDAGGSGVGQ